MPETAALTATKTEFAKLIGVSPGRVSQYLAGGQIHGEAIAGEGRAARIVVDVAQRQLLESIDLRRGRGVSATAAEAPPAGPALEKAPAAYTFELTRKARAEASIKELELRKRAGELIEIAAVISSLEFFGAMIVKHFESFADGTFVENLIAAVASGGTPALRAALKKRIHDARASVGDEIKRFMADGVEADEDDFDETPVNSEGGEASLADRIG